MNEEQFVIRESDIQDFFFHELVAAGLAPQSEDLEIISNIVFDYLIYLGIVDSVMVEDYDEEDED